MNNILKDYRVRETSKKDLEVEDNNNDENSGSDQDIDELLQEIEDDIDSQFYDSYREQRIQEFYQKKKRIDDQLSKGHGQLMEITLEKQLMDLLVEEPKCIVNFYLPDFKNCIIMNNYLNQLSKRYLDYRFLKISVGNTPFLNKKLQIKELPLVMTYRNGKLVNTLVGFNGLEKYFVSNDFTGNISQKIPLEALEKKLGL
ncbi:uncharacterized protein SCODWIG_02518 [Saccharomycodes ludwigii]|uniref:Phosducin domain-containing protein n=1 Tax=Saccharomycodes ludwigii TaxID=36035 RepID=A0A376B7T4_9ASCO|nr:hypothetical protein SCDLUD_001857 [Saccharomycodes ludwigii]KAH3902046.1 hypothetical protein SCDLUD_001857 [Saccharomycodes ludwigii]SSD60757.1 uncharacterized protein SCODWIG_02518 [Saccharomycodes ludwigii]